MVSDAQEMRLESHQLGHLTGLNMLPMFCSIPTRRAQAGECRPSPVGTG